MCVGVSVRVSAWMDDLDLDLDLQLRHAGLSDYRIYPATRYMQCNAIRLISNPAVWQWQSPPS